MNPAAIITVTNLDTRFGTKYIHRNLDFSMQSGDIQAVIGASGSGKTTLLYHLLMLHQAASGSIKIFDVDITRCSSASAQSVYRRWGVSFQHGALFSSLTIAENVMFPLLEFSGLNKQLCQELALLKLQMVGLEADVAHKYPAELSGGMIKRAAVARAIALDPQLLFFDEPTAGLDPNSASELGQLILNLRDTLGLSVLVITHDIEFLQQTTDRVAFLGEQKVLANLPLTELIHFDHPQIREYFRVYHERNT